MIKNTHRNLTHKQSRIIAFGFCVLVFIPIAMIGFQIEYSPDSFFGVSYKGVLNDNSVNTFYIYMQYWDVLLNKLYAFFPNVTWYGYFLLGYTLVSTYFFIESILKILTPLQTLPKVLLLAIIISLWSITLFYIGFTRIPFYVAGWVTLYIIIYQVSMTRLLFLGLFLCGACWFRYESMIAASLVLLPLLLFVFMNDKTRSLQILKQFIFVFSLGFIGILLHHQIYNQPEDLLAKEFFKAHFNFFDAHQRAIPQNAEDSIRIQAMSMDFNVDHVKLGLEEYKRLTLGNPLQLKGDVLIKDKIERSVKQLEIGYQNNKYLLQFYLWMLLLTVVTCYRTPKNLLILFLNQIWLWGLILGTTFFLKYADRVVQPILILSTISVLVCIYYSKKSSFYLSNPIVFLLVLFFFLIHYSKFYYYYLKDSRAIENIAFQHDNIITKLSEIQHKEHKDFIFTVDAYELFQTGMLNEVTKDKLLVYTYDTHNNYLPGMADAVKRYCDCNTLLGFYSYVYLHNDKTMIVASEKRMNMLKDYFRILYGYQMDVEKVDNFYPQVSAHSVNLHLYQIIDFYPIHNSSEI